jgi:hypothetical protein
LGRFEKVILISLGILCLLFGIGLGIWVCNFGAGLVGFALPAGLIVYMLGNQPVESEPPQYRLGDK